MKRFLKSFLLALLLVAAGVGALAGWAWWTTREPDQVTRNFLDAWANEDFDTALSLGTPGFRDAVNKRTLKQRREQWGVIDAEAIERLELSVSGDVATALIVVPYSPEILVAVNLILRKSEEGWAVQAVVNQGEGVTIAPAPGWPDAREVLTQVIRLLETLAEDAPSGEFRQTHRLLSWDFQQQFPLEKFNSDFAAFAGREGLERIVALPAEFDEMSIDFDERVVTVVGRFRSLPMNLVFTTEWIREGFTVRPLALFLSTEASAPESSP